MIFGFFAIIYDNAGFERNTLAFQVYCIEDSVCNTNFTIQQTLTPSMAGPEPVIGFTTSESYQWEPNQTIAFTSNDEIFYKKHPIPANFMKPTDPRRAADYRLSYPTNKADAASVCVTFCGVCCC